MNSPNHVQPVKGKLPRVHRPRTQGRMSSFKWKSDTICQKRTAAEEKKNRLILVESDVGRLTGQAAHSNPMRMELSETRNATFSDSAGRGKSRMVLHEGQGRCHPLGNTTLEETKTVRNENLKRMESKRFAPNYYALQVHWQILTRQGLPSFRH